MNNSIQNQAYKNWLENLKVQIKSVQIKASLHVNKELILLYYDLGRQIVQKQTSSTWGTSVIEQLSKDLQQSFVDISGFSKSNLYAMRQFYLVFSNFHQAGGNLDTLPLIIQNVCVNIPWRHLVVMMQKVKDNSAMTYYLHQTIENNWSRAVLEYQIETNLYARQGNAITNFKNTLPQPESDLAQALLKDSYNFEFLTLSSKVKELELEQKLIENITHFLLELGKGFAYMGRQFEINVGGEIFKTDLLFYHTKLKCYVVIELKVTKFKPEYVGKLNFYLTAIDRLVKDNTDKATIGILLCKSKNDVVVDFALHDVNKPVGVSEYTYTQLSDDIKNALPTIEQLTDQLENE